MKGVVGCRFAKHQSDNNRVQEIMFHAHPFPIQEHVLLQGGDGLRFSNHSTFKRVQVTCFVCAYKEDEVSSRAQHVSNYVVFAKPLGDLQNELDELQFPRTIITSPWVMSASRRVLSSVLAPFVAMPGAPSSVLAPFVASSCSPGIAQIRSISWTV